jgi:uncharacterized protein (DUF302 family)
MRISRNARHPTVDPAKKGWNPYELQKARPGEFGAFARDMHGPANSYAADDGIITKASRYSVKETVARFEAAVKQKEAAGFTVFTEIDHAAAAKKFGLDLRQRTVIVFGNPKLGTPAMVKTPLLAIDLPPKALVWEDDQGKVWLSYNSSDYISNTIYPRHGAAVPPAATAPYANLLDEMSDQATK